LIVAIDAMKPLWIDLNCDLGEVPEAVFDGTQDALMASITSANVACGAHAGDQRTMEATIRQALRHGVCIGAHPGFPDRDNFGRLEVSMTFAQISQTVYQQVDALFRIARDCGATIGHVKPHGALYNLAARDAAVSRAIGQGVAQWRRDVVLVGLAGSTMVATFREMGFDVAAEAFADRTYAANGSLRSRKLADAVIRDPQVAAAQALRIALEHRVTAADGSEIALEAQTVCIHGDTPGCVQIAAAVAEKLREAGINLKGVGQRDHPARDGSRS
jgi:5-oxoprolinase (ATP-hydrolysing) subunit A